jgi:hypothetical protein
MLGMRTLKLLLFTFRLWRPLRRFFRRNRDRRQNYSPLRLRLHGALASSRKGFVASAELGGKFQWLLAIFAVEAGASAGVLPLQLQIHA